MTGLVVDTYLEERHYRPSTNNDPGSYALFLCSTTCNIHIIVTHTDSTTNCIADTYCRFQVQRFTTTPDTIRAWLI